MARRPVAEPLSPGRFLRRGLDPTGRTKPGGFAALLFVMGGLWLLGRLGPTWIEGWGRGHEALAAIPLATLLVPGTGHALRRLNDMGRPGWWGWALLVPWLRWALLLVLLFAPTSQRRRRTDSRWRLLGIGVAGMAALILAGSLLWTTAPVLAQGMKPALRPGDLVLLRRAPVELRRGDVIAFRLEGEAALRIGRAVALGGERVAVEGGVAVINGARAGVEDDGLFGETFGPQGPQGVMPVCGNGPVGLGADCLTHRFLETLPDGTTYAVLDAGKRPLDAAGEVEVPGSQIYVLGDHRDAVRDSRLSPAVDGTGFVSPAQVIGRVDMVLASAEGRHWWDPRGWRLSRIGEIVR